MLLPKLVKPDPHAMCENPRNPKAFRLLGTASDQSQGLLHISEREWVRKAGDNYLEGEWEKMKNNRP